MLSTLSNPWLLIYGLATALVWKVSGTAIYRLARHQTTALGDLDQLGQRRKDSKFPGNAVVAGGSIAGLFAARVLSDHFENVVVIEPDTELNEKRTRVEQWCHSHIFLPLCRLILIRLFPNFDHEAERSGISIRPANYNLQMEGKTLLAQEDKVGVVLASTRMGFERLLRRLVFSSCENVTTSRGIVTGLKASLDGHLLTSATWRASGESGERSIELSYFLDCSGPATAAHKKWLPRARPEWESIRKDEYAPKISYSTGIYRLTPEVNAKLDASLPLSLRYLPYVRQIYGSAKSGCPLGYGIGRGDNDTVIITASRWGDGDLPTSIHDFVAYCQQVDAATSEEGGCQPAYDTVRIVEEAYPEATSGSRIMKTKVPNMYHVRYDLAKTLPDNFGVHGDALIRLNPTFGQGCTKAAMDAATLDACLRAVPSDRNVVPRGFSKKVIALQTTRDRPMYDSTRWQDYMYKTTVPTKGETLATGAFFRTFFRALVALAHKDANVGTQFASVMYMMEPTAMLMKPSLLLSILWNSLSS